MAAGKDHLKNFYLFTGLTEEQLEKIAGLVFYRIYQKGRIIFMEGETSDAVFLLKAGRVKIYKQDAEGREQILHYINPGDIFAEVVLFDGGTYPASAETVEDSEIGMIRNRQMDKLLIENPKITLALLKVMSRRLRFSQHQIMELALKDTTRRMAGILIQLAHEHGRPAEHGLLIPISLTNQELANLVGTSRETVNRTMSEFRRGKAVTVNRQEICVNVNLLKTWL